MQTIALPCGETVPALGQGTWNIGDDPGRRAEEIATLREGIALGLTLVDTAEMYGDGRSEQLVGAAIAGLRDNVFLVSKVYPHNAAPRAMRRSCEASLRRLGVDTSTCTCCTGRVTCRCRTRWKASRRCGATARSATGA
jgi:diketogulonate reductase-like aldo/keto reductase